jgi:predicted  nucleic acid-binding Zn-ribbon protein
MTAGTLRSERGHMTPVAELYALQELDLALEADRVAVADAESRFEEPEELIAAREGLAERQEALRGAEKLFKEQEYEADQVRAKIGPLEKKLYQGNVINPKELGDLQRDIESLQRRRNELEDVALSAMEGVETAQLAFREAQRALEQLTAQHQGEVETSRRRTAELASEIIDLERRRDDQAATIDAALRQLYDRLQANRQRGAVVAKVVGGACQGCRIALPMNLIQRARSGSEIVQCSSCERILYVS